jgi:hypothetical protein
VSAVEKNAGSQNRAISAEMPIFVISTSIFMKNFCGKLFKIAENNVGP